MPQRLKLMENDSLNFTIATVTEGVAWLTAESLTEAATALGLSSEDLDHLFIQASEIEL